MPEPTFEEMLDAMKAAAGALQRREIPFVLAGGLAAWARGGPKSEHDVDFIVKPEDADAALEAMADAGLRTERPPEGWLYKAWEDGCYVDLIFETTAGPVTDELFERSDELDVYAVRMQVASLEDVLVTKLLALSEQSLDFRPVLEISRSLREQIDWDRVRRRTADSPYAGAFFTLVERLGIAP